MAKFKVGDKVVIKDNKSFHRFQNGDVVVITVAHSDSYRGHKVGDDPEEWWAFEDSEIEEYKGGGKVQEFKIGDRVRMIKKRLYSFDRVGMTGTIVEILPGMLLEIEVDGEEPTMDGGGWTYWVEDENWEVIEEEPKMRVTSKVEPMCIYSFDSVEDMKVFLKIADQGGFIIGSCDYGIDQYGSDTRFRVNKNKYVTYGTYAYDAPDYPEYERVQFKVEEVKEMPKCKFKVGDLVKGNDPDRYFVTNDEMTKAEVVVVHNHDYIRVKVLEHLDDTKDSGVYEYDVDPQYFDFYEEPKLVQKEKPKTTVLKLDNYKIIFNGDTTVVTDGTRKGVAKRHPDDEYDAVVGLQVALERFHGGRKPKIGDKVRVLKVDGNSRYGRHSYSIGEIVTVINFAESDTDVCCKDRSSFRQTLIAGEYEVLG